ncbi:methyltransferase type 11 [Pyrenophora tritici-repentis]|nr:methyltransferase type 11 [Pyrenophora tritici-repentis]
MEGREERQDNARDMRNTLASQTATDSTVPYDLLARGYTNQVCLDFSTVVVETMKSRHSDKPQVEWQVGDVRDMRAIASGSVDVAFDKGTLDTMIYGSPWSPPDEVLENSGRYMKEVMRVLKDDDKRLELPSGPFSQATSHIPSPLSSSTLSWANTLLCSVSRQSYLPILHTLFDSARSQHILTTALLAEPQTDFPYQYIGQATF